MDPIVLIVIFGLVILLVLRMFFGFAKLIFKLAFVIIVAILIWRLFFVHG